MFAKNKSSKIAQSVLETLESRQLMSAAPDISFADFSNTAGLAFNGYGTSATTSSNALNLTTTSLAGQTRSVWDRPPWRSTASIRVSRSRPAA